MEEQRKPLGQLVMRTVAMPEHTNPNGHIFGGWILSQMDLGGGVLAKEISRNHHIVTVNASSVTFHKPAFIGDIVCCYAQCLKTGRTSMTIGIEIWIKRIAHVGSKSERFPITDAVFTYVSVDKEFKPKPLIDKYQHYNVENDPVEKLELLSV